MYYSMTYVVVTLLVLIFLNVYCSHASKGLFEQSKQDAMSEKAGMIAKELSRYDNLEIFMAAPIFDDYEDMNINRLIITNAAGMIVLDSEGLLPVIPPRSAADGLGAYPEILQALDGTPAFTWAYHRGNMRSVAAAPVYHAGTLTGSVYILEIDREAGELLYTLQTNIFTITVLLELGLILFAILYTRGFSKRLRAFLHSMRIIQDGDFSHKVDIDGHDEFSFLGQEFNYLTARLQTSENKRRQFVSDASHELKTPLASIKLLSDSILQNDMDMQTVREFVSDIGDEADRLTRMTGKLLELTKGQNDPDEVSAEIIYMGPTIQRVVKMLSTLAENSQIHIEMDLKNDAPILIHEDDLYQITFNLVENGIKYNTPGGKLSISLHRQDEMNILRVSDTGIGIPPEAVGHVFERFYRVDKARSRQTGGSGLGLAIVRSMVQRNGGQISLQSTIGKGTTFTVEFPAFDTEVDKQWEENP